MLDLLQPLPKWDRAEPSRLAPDPAVGDFVHAAHYHIAHAIKIENGKPCPMFGLLSQSATQIPVLPYGLATIKKRYPKSFVDGKSIFVSDDLIKTIALEESTSRGGWKGLEPLILLQELRIMMNHSTRLKTLVPGGVIPEDVAQLAGETSAYCKLRLGFPHFIWAPCIELDIAASVLPDEGLELYSMMAEEKIARKILEACSRFSGASSDKAPTRKVLLSALESMGMKPRLCAHIACPDSDFVMLAIVEQESRDIRRATRRTKKTAPTPSHGDQSRQTRRL